MDSRGIKALLFLGVIFGMFGGTVAFLRAYDGYSHFPAISRKKRLMMSLEYAVLAFVSIIGITVILLILLEKEMI